MEFEHPGDAQVVDHDAYRQVLNALGARKLDDILQAFVAQIRDEFTDGVLASEDLDLVAYHAHAMASAAGALGFLDLARASKDVEKACHGSGDLRERAVHARAARRRALAAIGALRTDRPAPRPGDTTA